MGGRVSGLQRVRMRNKAVTADYEGPFSRRDASHLIQRKLPSSLTLNARAAPLNLRV
jgi:hypothetical protein